MSLCFLPVLLSVLIYGIFVNDSSKDMELFGALKSIAQVAMQN